MNESNLDRSGIRIEKSHTKNTHLRLPDENSVEQR